MKLYRLLSNTLFKTLFIGGVLSCLTLSTTLDSLSLLTENSFDIETIDWQDDSSEETQEIKKEEKKLHDYGENLSSVLALLESQHEVHVLQTVPNIYLEIQLRPPRIA